MEICIQLKVSGATIFHLFAYVYCVVYCQNHVFSSLKLENCCKEFKVTVKGSSLYFCTRDNLLFLLSSRTGLLVILTLKFGTENLSKEALDFFCITGILVCRIDSSYTFLQFVDSAKFVTNSKQYLFLFYPLDIKYHFW